MAKVPVIVLRHLSAAQKEALRLADNRIAENATWDQALLRDALAGLRVDHAVELELTGFGTDEIAAILAAAAEAVSHGEAPEALSATDVAGGGAAGARRAKPSPAPAISGCWASIACSAATAPTPPLWRA